MSALDTHLAAGHLRPVVADPTRASGALSKATEHRAASEAAAGRGLTAPALASAVQAGRSALVGLTALAGYEVVLSTGALDTTLDAALCAVVETQWPELATCAFAEAAERAEATTSPVAPAHIQEATAAADALIAALAAAQGVSPAPFPQITALGSRRTTSSRVAPERYREPR